MAGKPLDVGDPAVDFTLPSTLGAVRLSEMLREGAVLLIFHPRDHTLVCTRQLCNYRDHLSTFEDLGVQLLAINDDPLDVHGPSPRDTNFPFPWPRIPSAG